MLVISSNYPRDLEINLEQAKLTLKVFSLVIFKVLLAITIVCL